MDPSAALWSTYGAMHFPSTIGMSTPQFPRMQPVPMALPFPPPFLPRPAMMPFIPHGLGAPPQPLPLGQSAYPSYPIMHPPGPLPHPPPPLPHLMPDAMSSKSSTQAAPGLIAARPATRVLRITKPNGEPVTALDLASSAHDEDGYSWEDEGDGEVYQYDEGTIDHTGHYDAEQFSNEHLRMYSVGAHGVYPMSDTYTDSGHHLAPVQHDQYQDDMEYSLEDAAGYGVYEEAEEGYFYRELEDADAHEQYRGNYVPQYGFDKDYEQYVSDSSLNNAAAGADMIGQTPQVQQQYATGARAAQQASSTASSVNPAAPGPRYHTPRLKEEQLMSADNVEQLARCAEWWVVILDLQGQRPLQSCVDSATLQQMHRERRLQVQTLMVGLSSADNITISPMLPAAFFRPLEYLLALVAGGHQYQPMTEQNITAGEPPAGWCVPGPLFSYPPESSTSRRSSTAGSRAADEAGAAAELSTRAIQLLNTCPFWSPVAGYTQTGGWRTLGCVSMQSAVQMLQNGRIHMMTPIIPSSSMIPRQAWLPTALMMPLGALVHIHMTMNIIPLSLPKMEQYNKDILRAAAPRVPPDALQQPAPSSAPSTPAASNAAGSSASSTAVGQEGGSSDAGIRLEAALHAKEFVPAALTSAVATIPSGSAREMPALAATLKAPPFIPGTAGRTGSSEGMSRADKLAAAVTAPEFIPSSIAGSSGSAPPVSTFKLAAVLAAPEFVPPSAANTTALGSSTSSAPPVQTGASGYGSKLMAAVSAPAFVPSMTAARSAPSGPSGKAEGGESGSKLEAAVSAPVFTPPSGYQAVPDTARPAPLAAPALQQRAQFAWEASTSDAAGPATSGIEPAAPDQEAAGFSATAAQTPAGTAAVSAEGDAPEKTESQEAGNKAHGTPRQAGAGRSANTVRPALVAQGMIKGSVASSNTVAAAVAVPKPGFSYAAALAKATAQGPPNTAASSNAGKATQPTASRASGATVAGSTGQVAPASAVTSKDNATEDLSKDAYIARKEGGPAPQNTQSAGQAASSQGLEQPVQTKQQHLGTMTPSTAPAPTQPKSGAAASTQRMPSKLGRALVPASCAQQPAASIADQQPPAQQNQQTVYLPVPMAIGGAEASSTGTEPVCHVQWLELPVPVELPIPIPVESDAPAVQPGKHVDLPIPIPVTMPAPGPMPVPVPAPVPRAVSGSTATSAAPAASMMWPWQLASSSPAAVSSSSGKPAMNPLTTPMTSTPAVQHSPGQGGSGSQPAFPQEAVVLLFEGSARQHVSSTAWWLMDSGAAGVKARGPFNSEQITLAFMSGFIGTSSLVCGTGRGTPPPARTQFIPLQQALGSAQQGQDYVVDV